MADATFTFRVEDELKADFTRAAKAQDRTGAQLLRDFMRDYVGRQQDNAARHDAWFRAEVEKALREADDPNARFMSQAEVDAERKVWRAKVLKRAHGR
jgi:predicted transcriptional regulator